MFYPCTSFFNSEKCLKIKVDNSNKLAIPMTCLIWVEDYLS